ncbi:MAG: hypothetical protein J0J01_31080 [Reyranella sp.]|uniref:hypothetical protein n=1 Tax=Reyranella sp. TaxID=1929291 RepID=UPI001AC0FAB2|nr:hypothetical protein [Reyranella sp.]MBN9091384.1 hypothetical protein [Reyranella sp.]
MPTATTKPPVISPRLERLLLVPLFALPVIWLAGYFFPPINHDVGAILYVTDRWLGGEKLYVDIIDENLPLTFIVHALPVLTARILPGGVPLWFTAWVVGGIALSFYACRRLVRLVPSADHALTEALLPPVLLFLFTVLPNEHFGQREHIMFVACAPYLIASMARAEGVQLGRWSAIVIGLTAGLFLAMKPYYLAIPATVELFLLTRRGWRATFIDRIPWSIFAVALTHLVLMYTVFSVFGRFIMPMALESYEPIGDAGWRQVLTSNVMLPTLIALLLFGAFAIFLTRALAARALLAFGIGAALSAIAQAKGWPYHVLPALSAAILLATFTLSQTVDRYLPIDRSAHRLPVAVISATLMVLLYFQAALYTPPFYKQRQYQDSVGGILAHIVEQNAPHRTILTLSPGIYPFWPMLNYVDGRMTMRLLTMWVVQGVYADCEDFPALYNAPDTMGDTEKFVFDAVSEDFARGQPDLLIVDTIPGMPRCQGKVFDYLEYFQQNKVFADAFEHYEHLMDFDRYKIYRKKKHG